MSDKNIGLCLGMIGAVCIAVVSPSLWSAVLTILAINLMVWGVILYNDE